MNLVPGATPAQFQNAEIDSPGRSLRTWVNGTQPNSNATRIDGAVSVNIWLPHHVGYVQPAETIETVNVSTNSFDAEYGMAGGAAATVVTKSGTNEVRGSAFWFGNHDELNANSLLQQRLRPGQGSPLTRNIYGGTVGGPVVHNKLFYFGSFERFADRARLARQLRRADRADAQRRLQRGGGRLPDLPALQPVHRRRRRRRPRAVPEHHDPGVDDQPDRAAVLGYYPLPNTTADLNSNQLPDDYQQFREVQADRDNYDMKMTWQRNASHSMWGKFAMLDADVIDNFSLGFDEGSLGDTRVYVVGRRPHLDAQPDAGARRQLRRQHPEPAGDRARLRRRTSASASASRGIERPTTSAPSGLPTSHPTDTATTSARRRTGCRCSARSAATPSAPRSPRCSTSHDVRVGVDVVRHELNHIQAEFGDYRRRARRLPLQRHRHRRARATRRCCGTSSAGFLLGLPDLLGKDVQTEEMTGREWQSAIYVRDRWNVNPNSPSALGLRLENYPLMTRADRGIERLDYSTYTVLIGGLGDVPDDVGINLKTLVLRAAARRDVPLQREVGRARRLRPHDQPAALVAADARLVPAGHLLQPDRRPVRLRSARCQDGIPAVPIPDISSGRVHAAAAACSCARRIRPTSTAAPSSSGTSPTSTACRATSPPKWPTSARAPTAATPT